MPGQFDLQPNFPIASVADLIAARPYKEAQMRQQQQQQLVQGLQGFGQGVQSLVNRRNMMAQALAQSQIYSQMHPELSTTTQNQTVAATPGSANGTTTVPSTPGIDPQTLQSAFLGLAPKDFVDNLAQNQNSKLAQGELALKQQIEPQKLTIEARKAAAEEENNKIQRMVQQMLAGATIKNQAQERTQAAENAALEANKETAKHFILHPIDAYKASKNIAASGNTNAFSLPAVGESVKHPSGVTIKRIK